MSENMEVNYSDRVRRLFEKYGISLFDKLEIRHKRGGIIRGVILPRPEIGDPDVLILKLDNGYNIGLHIENISSVRIIGHLHSSPLVEVRKQYIKGDKPPVYFLGTGGTIASRIDYKTGAVYPFFTAEEIYSMVPELEDLAFIKAENLLNIFSEDMRQSYWSMIAERVAKIFEREAPKGIVIAHGTDTMGYTAAALAFAVRQLPGPIILVGAQRSSDRPSSDSALNVIAATITALKAPFGESVVVMHGSVSDTFCLVHRGVKVRKCHTSRRDAFRSINDIPLARIDFPDKFNLLNKKIIPRKNDGIILEKDFDSKVALVKFFPGMTEEIIDFLLDKGIHGIVLEGTGLGHVAKTLIKALERAHENEVPVVMTSQCIWGRINMNVYRRGRELLKAGVIPGEDMLPETAFVKLSWVLGKGLGYKEVKRLMLTNIVYEINPRSENRSYPPLWGC